METWKHHFSGSEEEVGWLVTGTDVNQLLAVYDITCVSRPNSSLNNKLAICRLCESPWSCWLLLIYTLSLNFYLESILLSLSDISVYFSDVDVKHSWKTKLTSK